MLLTVDIGNTETVMGLFEGSTLKLHWRFSSICERTTDELFILISGLFDSGGIKTADITGAVICSVVPSVDKEIKEALSRLIGKDVCFVGGDILAPMPIITDNPEEVGSDRIVNAVAAHAIFKGAAIIVDFGTAITVDLVTEKGEYAGGAIAPGVGISAEALFVRTSLLPRVEIRRPAKVLGANTREAIQSGIYYGFSGLVDKIVSGIIKECGCRPPVVATGGLSEAFREGSKFITHMDEFLTLKGLNLIYKGR
ncbi:MAG: type III pantothenate kinase [Thermodesulfobacteriota bacterium]